MSKIDSLESIVRMLELKTKNSHDHGTNTIGISSLPIHSSSLYSRVEDLVLFFLFYVMYILYMCIFLCIASIMEITRKIWDINLFSFYYFLLRYFFIIIILFHV